MQTFSARVLLYSCDKSANPHCFKNLDKNDLPVDYYAQKSSWMDSSIYFQTWFHDKFVPRWRKALAEKGVPKKVILLLDNAPSHLNVDCIRSSDENIFCLYLPPNTTSLIQPMDQGVLKNIKRCYKRELLLRLLNDEHEGLNMVEFTKTLTILDAVLMSAKCWSEVEKCTISRSWNKLLYLKGAPAKEKGKDTDTNIEIDTIMDELQVTPEEQSEWLTMEDNDPGYHEYSDEELVVHVTGNNDEGEEQNDVVTQSWSHGQACQAL